MQGATQNRHHLRALISISIHAPHAGSDSILISTSLTTVVISIHAPHAGSDRIRGRNRRLIWCISIHAPHAGSDFEFVYSVKWYLYFNPRSPCRERHHPPILLVLVLLIQSTLPCRATHNILCRLQGSVISIHAPHAGSDLYRLYFGVKFFISIHAPTQGATRVRNTVLPMLLTFQSRSPCRSDSSVSSFRLVTLFQSRPHAGSDPGNASPVTPGISIAPHAGSD